MGLATVDGVGVTTSQTYNQRPPIEPGREGATVVTITRISGGTGQVAGVGKATTCDNPNGSGCTITTTVTGGVVDGQPVVAGGGDGYRVGDVLSVAGTTAATFRVDTVSYTN